MSSLLDIFNALTHCQSVVPKTRVKPIDWDTFWESCQWWFFWDTRIFTTSLYSKTKKWVSKWKKKNHTVTDNLWYFLFLLLARWRCTSNVLKKSMTFFERPSFTVMWYTCSRVSLSSWSNSSSEWASFSWASATAISLKACALSISTLPAASYQIGVLASCK